MFWTARCDRVSGSVFLGANLRNRPFAFSTPPFCQGLCGSQKKVCMPSFVFSKSCFANSVPLSWVSVRRMDGGKRANQLLSFAATRTARLSDCLATKMNRENRSWTTRRLSFLLLKSIKSASQWPGCLRASTDAGRWSSPTRCLICWLRVPPLRPLYPRLNFARGRYNRQL